MDPYFPRGSGIDDPEFDAARAEVDFDECLRCAWQQALDSTMARAAPLEAEPVARTGAHADAARARMHRRVGALAFRFAAGLSRALEAVVPRAAVATKPSAKRSA